MHRVGRVTLATIAALLTALPVASQKQMAITFDDLPAHGKLPPGETRLSVAQSILDTLKREHMPPVYGFVNGLRMEENPEGRQVLELWHKSREPLGNHTWAHTNLDEQTAEQFMADVEKNAVLLRELDRSGDTRWLRYPYLHEGDTVEKRRAVRAALFAAGYRIAEVGMDFEDYLWNEPYARCSAKHDEVALQYLHDSYLATAEQYTAVYREMAQHLFGHDIPYVLLMHVGAFDAKMLPELLALYRREGFTFVTMPAALQDPAYAVDPDIGSVNGDAITGLLEEARHMKAIPNSKPYQKLSELCK